MQDAEFEIYNYLRLHLPIFKERAKPKILQQNNDNIKQRSPSN